MKNENYNVIIKTLDDRAMYKEIGRRLSELDRNRYMSMWLVPLLSGIIVLLLWLELLQIPIAINMIVSLFGAMITYFIFRWTKQNIQQIRAFRQHAALLESRKKQQENLPPDSIKEGPYSFIEYLSKPSEALQQPGSEAQKESYAAFAPDWNKGKAERAVYLATILLWLLTILLGVLKIIYPLII